MGLNSSFESFMQKNSRSLNYCKTGYRRLCFFFLDNTITSFKFLKLADILRKSQGIYTPSKKIVTVSGVLGVLINYRSLHSPYDTQYCANFMEKRLLSSLDSIMCISKLRHQKVWQLFFTYMYDLRKVCKMQYPLNLMLENCKYPTFYLTFQVVISNGGLKLPKLLIHTLVMLKKWLEIH